MKVRELILELQKVPQDFEVIWCSTVQLDEIDSNSLGVKSIYVETEEPGEHTIYTKYTAEQLKLQPKFKFGF